VVAYHIELHEANVAPYLAGLELSTEGREALRRVLDELATYGDLFLRDPERRLAPDSDTFSVRWIFRDPTTKLIHALRLIISDAAVQYGVLQVVFADEHASRWETAFS
jgi:hypothetical protein